MLEKNRFHTGLRRPSYDLDPASPKEDVPCPVLGAQTQAPLMWHQHYNCCKLMRQVQGFQAALRRVNDVCVSGLSVVRRLFGPEYHREGQSHGDQVRLCFCLCFNTFSPPPLPNLVSFIGKEQIAKSSIY